MLGRHIVVIAFLRSNQDKGSHRIKFSPNPLMDIQLYQLVLGGLLRHYLYSFDAQSKSPFFRQTPMIIINDAL
jgi:hypothetical protein